VEATVPRPFPLHGWLGLGLVAVTWTLNWTLDGPRTHVLFFPLWLGYCLVVDALALWRRGTSLFARDRRLYAGLYLVSVPLWWLFELLNLRLQNWHYGGRETIGPLAYAFWASLSFSTVVPAMLGTAELVAGTSFVQGLRRGRPLHATPRMARGFALAGATMLALLLVWPQWAFPLTWLALYFLFESVNLARGHLTLLDWTARGDWRPIVALALASLVCGFFWEMWNVLSWPKWYYTLPYLGFWKVFEMPVFGYLGYLPFSLEVFAAVSLALGSSVPGRREYVARAFAPR
jgi:hypothetical protein